MKHFVAYHSQRVMGQDYPTQASGFYSSKPRSFLQKTLASRIWVINGSVSGKKTRYTLRAYFTPDKIVELEKPKGGYELTGQTVTFAEPIELDGFNWFYMLRQKTGNFGIGIAEIKDEATIKALMSLGPVIEHSPQEVRESFHEQDPLNFEVSAIEGSEQRSEHLRRERNRTLIETKKKLVQARTGRLACEVCGFDFCQTYGAIGEGVCEVHHKSPLAQLTDPTITKLDDLGILCSNCHRIIHRTDPMLTIEDFRQLLKET